MNGAQHTKDTLAQKPPQGATAPAASANGSNNSTINKKRKKDGLKPIITTEGPGYVHSYAFCPTARDRLITCYFSISPFPISSTGFRACLSLVLGSRDQVPSTLRPHCAARAPARWRGATGGPWDPWTHGGESPALRTHARMLRHHTTRAHGHRGSPSSERETSCRYFDVSVALVSRAALCLAPLPPPYPESPPLLTASRLLPPAGGSDINLSLLLLLLLKLATHHPTHSLPFSLAPLRLRSQLAR